MSDNDVKKIIPAHDGWRAAIAYLPEDEDRAELLVMPVIAWMVNVMLSSEGGWLPTTSAIIVFPDGDSQIAQDTHGFLCLLSPSDDDFDDKGAPVEEIQELIDDWMKEQGRAPEKKKSKFKLVDDNGDEGA